MLLAPSLCGSAFSSLYRSSGFDWMKKISFPTPNGGLCSRSSRPPPMAFALLNFLIVLLSLCNTVYSEPAEDKEALLAFFSRVPHSRRTRWNASASACSWVGVSCDRNRSSVVSLRLPAIGLIGQIPAGTLGRLARLRVLSLRSNLLAGGLPPDFANLTLLRCLFLQNNNLSGRFPESLTGLTRLTRLDLSSNRFRGGIPPSIANLTRLSKLLLQRNEFSGGLPIIDITSLKDLNVSYNNLSGPIPSTLQRFPGSSFAGNNGLCGLPLALCNNETSKRRPSRKMLVAIAVVVGSFVLLFLSAGLIFLLCCWRGHRLSPTGRRGAEPGAFCLESTSSSKDISGAIAGEGLERKKLVFLDESGIRGFVLEDLLGASAEVMGRGSMGTTYKAVVAGGAAVAVKRLKEVAASRREFERQMREVGKMTHENVVPVRAFYYAKDEKLIVSDFIEAGSLSALLHGERRSGGTLSWEQRLRIALGAARGLAHIHRSAVHGALKSSNVLLRPTLDACVSDYGLHPLFSALADRVSGYHAPELTATRNPSAKSDVYSYGVLLLELLTGKPPLQAPADDEGPDLSGWVQSVVRDELATEVLDEDLVKRCSSEEETEMLQLLQIAAGCVSTSPDLRPSIEQVVGEIQEIEQRRIVDEHLSSVF